MNSIERRTIRHLLSVSATMLVPFVLIGALIAGWRGAALGIAIGFAIQPLAWALAQPHKVVSMPTAAILFHRFMLSPEKFAGETGP